MASTNDDMHIGTAASTAERITVTPKGEFSATGASSPDSHDPRAHGTPQVIGDSKDAGVVTHEQPLQQPFEQEAPASRRSRWFAYLKSRRFWIVLALTQTLAVCTTGTNVFTTLLANNNVSIPAFQSLFNYVLLNIVYSSYTIYKFGLKKWLHIVMYDGWKYFILAFFDVQGNYFVVLGYRYTNILSAQLISFWTIVVVVILSLILLKVRYHIAQYAGIILCCGGFAILIASDHITGASDTGIRNAVKGDLFVLVSASCYGITNVLEEFFVSKKPLYEVVGQLAFWAMLINGVQAAIFDRDAFQSAVWAPAIGGYLTGYTLLLFIFYSLAPIVFRMSSAAFFNIGLLTGSFWGTAIGHEVFGYPIHFMYPIAFVLIIIGHFVYYGTEGVLGDAKKPWLAENQEDGDNGLGTARRQIENPRAIV